MGETALQEIEYRPVKWGEYEGPLSDDKDPTDVKKPAMVSIDVNMCKGCELCVYYCPQQTLAMADTVNERGMRFAHVVLENCTGCQECARVCPDVCITIWRE